MVLLHVQRSEKDPFPSDVPSQTAVAGALRQLAAFGLATSVVLLPAAVAAPGHATRRPARARVRSRRSRGRSGRAARTREWAS